MRNFFERVPDKKELLHKKAAEEVENLTDKLGKKIDSEIKEAVIALKMNDIETNGSCEGHENWGYPFPWVDVIAPVMISDQYKKLVKKHANKETLTPAEEEETLLLRNRLVSEEEEILGHLNSLLDEFYKNNAGENLIIIKKYASFYRIQPLGADSFKAVGIDEKLTESETEKRKEFLNKTRNEMKRFVSFLNAKV